MRLEVSEVTSGYGKVEVLHDISIRVGEGERVGLFGPNGHGKTTLLRTVSGLVRARSGSIVFGDQVIVQLPPRKIVNMGLIHVPQGNTLYPRMTVMESLLLGAYAEKAWPKRHENLETVFSLFPKLRQRKDQLTRTLSGGERQMVSIGAGLMGMPRLMMLDEPTLGLAPKVKDELAQAISEIAASGVTMLVVDQDIELLLGVCRRLYFIENGRVTLETEEGAVIDRAQILEMYFGAANR
jgi:branched-chain amino acid transport system ATP-binding protein